MTKRPALGKGIGALISSATQEGRHKYFLCPVEELRPHSKPPRKSFDDAKMAELVASIREKGVIQPLVVRQAGDHYQIIAGERRWRAAQRAVLREIPVVVREATPREAFELALVENLQRHDLDALPAARSTASARSATAACPIIRSRYRCPEPAPAPAGSGCPMRHRLGRSTAATAR